MSSLAVMLGAQLRAGPVPRNGPDLVEYAGGRDALAQELSGLPRAPRRGDYTRDADFEAARRRWRAARRRVQRWSTEAGQRRGRSHVVIEPAIARRLRTLATARRRDLLRRRGARNRIHAWVVVTSPGKPDDERLRWLPAPPGPGVYLDGATMGAVISERDPEYRAALWSSEFLDGYGFMDAKIRDVIELRIWPEGTREPA